MYEWLCIYVPMAITCPQRFHSVQLFRLRQIQWPVCIFIKQIRIARVKVLIVITTFPRRCHLLSSKDCLLPWCIMESKSKLMLVEKDHRSKNAKAYEDLHLKKSTKIKPLNMTSCVIIQIIISINQCTTM